MYRFLKLLGIALMGLWLLGGIWYYRLISTYPPVQTVKSDAIVVLTGGSGRLSGGAQLFLKNMSAHLFVTGVNTGTTKGDLAHLLDLDLDHLNSSVTLGYEAHDTEGNAKETKQWILQNHVKSIALVTAHYHMPRSLIAFHRILGDIEITPVAIIPDLFQEKGQWRRKTQVLLFEYNKFLMALFKTYVVRV